MEYKKEIERINVEIKKLQDQKDKLERDHYDEICEINKGIMQKLYDSIKLGIQDHKVIFRGGGSKPKIVNGVLTCGRFTGVIIYEIPFDVDMNPVWARDYKVTWHNTIYAQIHFDQGKCIGCGIYRGSDSSLSSDYSEIRVLIDDLEFISHDEFKKITEAAVNSCHTK